MAIDGFNGLFCMRETSRISTVNEYIIIHLAIYNSLFLVLFTNLQIFVIISKLFYNSLYAPLLRAILELQTYMHSIILELGICEISGCRNN